MRQRGRATAWVCCLGLGGVLALDAHGVPGAADDRARARAYHEFRERFDAGDYAAALPHARELVRLTRRDGPDGDRLPKALNNLGVVQLRSGAAGEAERSFVAALDMLERSSGVVSARKLPALAGLAAAQSAQGRHPEAVTTLKEALALSWRSAGLFNPDQLDMLEALASNLEILGEVAGVDRQRQYAVEVVQRTHGVDDPRVLPWLEALASWYERSGRYGLALDVHRRRVEVASAEDGGRNEATIRGLLDLARAQRLYYLSDPEAAVSGTAGVPGSLYTDRMTWQPSERAEPMAMPRHTRITRPNQEGLRALERALGILDSVGSPPPRLLAQTLVSLGDWYLTEGSTNRSLEAYARAWPLLEQLAATGEPNPLASPRPVTYLPAVGAGPVGNGAAGRVARRGDFRIVVEADGTVSSAAFVGGDLPEPEASQVRRALSRASFSPRFESGQAVPTDALAYSETRWLPPGGVAERVAAAPVSGSPQARPGEE